MKYIYITLIRAYTGLGAAARKLTGYEYTHTAVCFDRSFEDFVSFSRRRHYLPFDAGLTHEKRDFYAFGDHKDLRVKIFRLPVSERNYESICRYIEECENGEYIFDLYGMISMPLFHFVSRFRKDKSRNGIYKSYNCMSFTAKIIQLSGAAEISRSVYSYSIKDIDLLLEKYFFFEGRLKRHDTAGYKDYMKPVQPAEYIRTGAGLIMQIISRIGRK